MMQMRFFLVPVFCLFLLPVFSTGIIIGNDSLVQQLFQTPKQEVINLADEISSKYDKVILHMGSKYAFDEGSFFATPLSQQNLQLFSQRLESNHVKLYLWFLDSYGSKMFKEIHADHREIIGDMKFHLDRLTIPYHGLVLDMEWINRPYGNHNDQYIEILKNTRKAFSNKELYVFASLIDDTAHNSKRGFDEERILEEVDNIIPMLYPVDGGFYLDYNTIKLRIDDKRIEELRTYFMSRNYIVAVSLEYGMLFKKRRKVSMVNHLCQDDPLFNDLKKQEETHYTFFSVYTYKAFRPITIPRMDEKDFLLKKKHKIYYFKINKEMIKEEDVIWEYMYARNLDFQ